jgi:lyso-ornithine lipid O-acyltransferase
MRPSVFRGIVRTLLFFTWTILLVPPYLLLFILGRWIRRPFVSLWHRGVCALIGMKVNCHGTPYQGPRVLLAGNHVSYLDIPILASCYDLTFVAKADVASWPVFGFLAKIAQTAFIERKPSKARQQKIELKQRILNGEHLMIFPEGTSSKGDCVLPFKSALFEMVMEDDMREHCAVQPVTIAFSKTLTGHALDETTRDNFAWYGDMTLLPHLWNVFCLKGVHVDIIFHSTARAADFTDRKALANWAESRVRGGMDALLNQHETSDDTAIEEARLTIS